MRCDVFGFLFVVFVSADCFLWTDDLLLDIAIVYLTSSGECWLGLARWSHTGRCPLVLFVWRRLLSLEFAFLLITGFPAICDFGQEFANVFDVLFGPEM